MSFCNRIFIRQSDVSVLYSVVPSRLTFHHVSCPRNAVKMDSFKPDNNSRKEYFKRNVLDDFQFRGSSLLTQRCWLAWWIDRKQFPLSKSKRDFSPHALVSFTQLLSLICYMYTHNRHDNILVTPYSDSSLANRTKPTNRTTVFERSIFPLDLISNRKIFRNCPCNNNMYQFHAVFTDRGR